MLGHTSEADFNDTDRTPKNLREVEAEAVALLCCEALDLEGAEFCRGYIQEWIKPGSDSAIPEKSAQKILKAADSQSWRNGLMESGRTQASLLCLTAFYQTEVHYGKIDPTRCSHRDRYANRNR